MSRGAWSAAVLRLAFVVLVLSVLTGVITAAFVGAGRPLDQALAAGCGLLGIGVALLGVVLLGLARRGEGRITQGTGFGALALSVPLLAAALII